MTPLPVIPYPTLNQMVFLTFMIDPVMLAHDPAVPPLPATPTQMVSLTIAIDPALLVQDPAILPLPTQMAYPQPL